jgi:hypothetical protein
MSLGVSAGLQQRLALSARMPSEASIVTEALEGFVAWGTLAVNRSSDLPGAGRLASSERR